MESTSVEVVKEQIKFHYVVYAPVASLRPSDLGGWWINFLGSRESIHFPGDKPFNYGDTVKITFEKVEAPCPPSPSTNPPQSSSS